MGDGEEAKNKDEKKFNLPNMVVLPNLEERPIMDQIAWVCCQDHEDHDDVI
jgi:hypothetical protein